MSMRKYVPDTEIANTVGFGQSVYVYSCISSIQTLCVCVCVCVCVFYKYVFIRCYNTSSNDLKITLELYFK